MSDNWGADTVVAVLRRHAESRGTRSAAMFVADPDRDDSVSSLDYAALDVRARAIAVWLLDRGTPGDRVLLLYPAGIDFAAAFLGCLYAGMVAVPSPLPGRYHQERRRVASIVGNGGISLVLTTSGEQAGITAWAQDAGLDHLDRLATDGGIPADPTRWREPRIDGSTLALLQYTSGSTGDPKGVMVTHRHILSNVDALRRCYGLSQDTVIGGWVPLFHDMGLLAQLLPALLLGSTCVMMSPTSFLKRPVSWLKLIDKYAIHWSAGPNFAFEMCTRKVTDEQIAQLDLSRWQHAVDGSEPVRAATLTAFAKRFAPTGFRFESCASSYGLAEATVYVCGSAQGEPVIQLVDAERLQRNEIVSATGGASSRELISCGPAGHGFDIRIVDPENGRVLGADVIGEIWVRGPSVALGYWQNEEATAAAFDATTADGETGYLRTGDLGALIDGELYVTGRRKETIIIHGRNHYPQDIEHEMRAQFEGLGAIGAVFTVPLVDAGDESSEEEVLVLTHEVEGKPSPEWLRQTATDLRFVIAREFGVRVAGVALLRRGTVRRTTSGKIQRREMRQLFLDGELATLHADVDPRLTGGAR